MTSLDPNCDHDQPEHSHGSLRGQDKRGCRSLRLGGVQGSAGCEESQPWANGKMSGRTQPTGWLENRPSNCACLQGQRTAATALYYLSLGFVYTQPAWPLYTGRLLPVCWGCFSLCIAAFDCCGAVGACSSGKPATYIAPPLICLCLLCFLCSAGLPFERFLLADRLRSKRDKHKHTQSGIERFKSDGQTSQLRRGHSSSHSVAHFPPTEAPSPARPSRRSSHPPFLPQPLTPPSIIPIAKQSPIAHRPSSSVISALSSHPPPSSRFLLLRWSFLLPILFLLSALLVHRQPRGRLIHSDTQQRGR